MLKLKKISSKLASSGKVPLSKTVIIGFSGKMYLPESYKDLEDESFAMCRPYKVLGTDDRDIIKNHWDSGGQIQFS